jgi:hypothetical protein
VLRIGILRTSPLANSRKFSDQAKPLGQDELNT